MLAVAAVARRLRAAALARGAERLVLDQPARLVPAEEIIWTKAFIMERERYDGADVAHILRACADLDLPLTLNHNDLLGANVVATDEFYASPRMLALYGMPPDTSSVSPGPGARLRTTAVTGAPAASTTSLAPSRP